MNEIKKIVFTRRIENNNPIDNAYIIYDNQSFVVVSKETGVAAVSDYIKGNNNIDINELRSIGIVDCIKEEEFATKYANLTNKTQEKHNGGIKAIAILGVITASLVGLSMILTKSSKTGTMIVDENNKIEQDGNENNNNNNNNNVLYNNDYYNNYTYNELLKVTYSGFQKNAMNNASSSLIGFNKTFANNYIESDKDIKAALSFDEIVALQQAYNNYSKNEIKAYFNGYEVDAAYMSKAYKSASLQLTGAYIIESSENKVDISSLIDSQEGKDFYNKYHTMYLKAKEATGKEKEELINEFYKAVKEDFPITEEIRTEGISHFDSYNSIKDYQLAVTPIIAAAEMIFQKQNIDYTLNDSEIEFFNDIGLCNYADDKFERIETITLTAEEDVVNPLYNQYKSTIIKELVDSNTYVIDDEHRELSNLQRFQEIVNDETEEKHKTTYSGEYGSPYTKDYGKTTTKTWEDEKTTKSEPVISTSTNNDPLTKEDKDKVDNKVNSENEKARAEAEKAAEEEKNRQQTEADKDKTNVEKEVTEENNKTQENIDNINTTVNNGDTPNDNNYNNVDFDNNHSNKNGDLDNSVKNVTTDGSGANEPLPDPNEYGKDFDTKAKQNNNTSTKTNTQTNKDTRSVEVVYQDSYPEYDENGNPVKVKVR